VTPETAGHLDKAREYPTKARNLLGVMHYLAGFHAVTSRFRDEAPAHRYVQH